MSNSTRMIGLRLTGVLVVAVAASFSLLVLGTISVKASPQTVATTYVVTRTDDGFNDFGCGAAGIGCTLRGAIGFANGNPGSTIQLTHGATYVLTNTTSGELLVSADMTLTTDIQCIFLPCPAVIQGKPGWNTRILEVGSSAHVNLNNLTLRYGHWAFGNGGGLLNGRDAKATVYSTSILNNTSGNSSGGLYNAGTLTLIGDTVQGNSANLGDGGGISNTYSLRARNSLLGGNVSATSWDCAGAFTSQGYNLVEHASGCVGAGSGSGDLVNVGSQLDALKDNGGPTWTHALLSSSPAINAGNPTGCQAT